MRKRNEAKWGKKGQKSSQLQSNDEVRQAQTALQQKGIDPGPIDGIMGPKTKKAIADFQRQQNLSASGSLDRQTEAALGVGGMTGEEQGRQKPSDVTPNPNLNPFKAIRLSVMNISDHPDGSDGYPDYPIRLLNLIIHSAGPNYK